MDLNKFKNSIDRLIYDPIKGRFLFDLLITFSTTYIIFFLYYFPKNYSQFLFPFSYSTLFLTSNIFLGLYGKNRTASLTIKSLILFTSNLIAFITLLIITNQYFLTSLYLFVITIFTVMPRFFLNFNIERTAFSKLAVANNKNPILIVGGGGYIGSILVEELLKKGEKVRVFDKFIYGKDVFKGIKNKKNLEIQQGDISDVYAITLAVKDTKAIVHLAGIVGDPAAKIDEELTRHVNIASTRLLKETAKAFSVEKFIFASSCSVYGAANKIQNENSRPKPLSLYAKTKLDSEKELLSDTADNFHPVILRFSTVFGHSRKPRFDLVANLFTAEAYYKKRITVFNGTQWRPFIHVKDIASAIISVLDAPNELVSRQIYNVGDEKMNIRIIELAKLIKNVANNEKVGIKIIKTPNDKRDYQASFEKINRQLNFNSKITFEEGIKEIYKNLLNNKYKKAYLGSYYVNSVMTKKLKKEFQTKRYKKSHFSTIS